MTTEEMNERGFTMGYMFAICAIKAKEEDRSSDALAILKDAIKELGLPELTTNELGVIMMSLGRTLASIAKLEKSDEAEMKKKK